VDTTAMTGQRAGGSRLMLNATKKGCLRPAFRCAVGAALALLTAALPAAAQAGSSTAPANPAVANIQTQHFSMTFGPDTNAIKEYHVPCPPTMKVYGGGARIGPAGGAGGNVMISGAEPYSNSFGTGFNVRAMARPGYDTAWSLTVYAICGTTLPGWELSTHVAYGHGESRRLNAVAACSAARVVVGMGGMVIGGNRKVALSHVMPLNEFWVGAGGQFDSTTGGLPVFNVRATAICAYEPPGWVRSSVVAEGGDATGAISAIGSCPAGKILSIGFAKSDTGHVYITNLTPLNLTTVQIAGRPRSPADFWHLSGNLICAT
jgi:hypothetical protein